MLRHGRRAGQARYSYISWAYRRFHASYLVAARRRRDSRRAIIIFDDFTIFGVHCRAARHGFMSTSFAMGSYRSYDIALRDSIEMHSAIGSRALPYAIMGYYGVLGGPALIKLKLSKMLMKRWLFMIISFHY